MTRIPVNPEQLTWAHERAGLDTLALAGRFPKLAQWEAGELQPTLCQRQDFVRVPINNEIQRLAHRFKGNYAGGAAPPVRCGL